MRFCAVDEHMFVIDQANTAIIAAEIAAISSSAVAIILAVSGMIERRNDRKRETMINALEHLTGGAQERSVGIALIEGLWYEGHPFDRAILPALVNQAVYLLLETDKGNRRDQTLTWLRIMNLVLRVPPRSEFHDLYCELAEALEQRSNHEKHESEPGIEVASVTTKMWLKKVKSHASL